MDFLMESSSTTAPDRKRLTALLHRYSQEHLLRFWDELDGAGQKQLARQIEGIDFEQISELFRNAAAAQDWAAMSRRAKPPTAMRIKDRKGGGLFDPGEARRRGAEALAAGKIGVLVVAGGQGSRLGFDHPKGLYPIGPVSRASLLQIHFEKVIALARRYGSSVPVYMMTSPVTHDEQVEFLQQHERFGLPEDDLFIFCQATMPA